MQLLLKISCYSLTLGKAVPLHELHNGFVVRTADPKQQANAHIFSTALRLAIW